MKTIQTQIDISAPASEVWNVLMDHSNYPKWNPFIKEITGSTEEGNNLAVTIQPENKKPMNFEPVVLKNEKGIEFRWLGHLFVKGLFDGEHFFKLEPISENETRFVHGENFRGVMVAPLLRMIGANTENGFNAMNVALKQRAEYNNQNS